MSTRTLHVGIHRDLLLAEIRQHGAAKVLQNFAGNDADAIAAIEADPREWITATECDNQAPDGHCLGHPKPLSEMTEAEFREDQRRRRAEEPEPVHTWFSLSYSSYMVLPRSILQSMPVEWQRLFIECIHELQEAAPADAPSAYTVNLRNAAGRFVRDPYCDYERGRRRVPLRTGATS